MKKGKRARKPSTSADVVIKWVKKDKFVSQYQGNEFRGEVSKSDRYKLKMIRVRYDAKISDLMPVIEYETNPLKSLRSLETDIRFAIKQWLHDRGNPEKVVCPVCNCKGHSSSRPNEDCIHALKARPFPVININQLTTIDNLLLQLREFRDTCIRCGGTRGFELRGDKNSANAWIEVDLTRQAMLMQGRVPSVSGNSRVVDHASTTNEKINKVKEDKVPKAEKSKATSGSIDDLVEKLKNTEDPKERKRIRELLRRLGHKGGGR